jgi:hypothetical protein
MARSDKYVGINNDIKGGMTAIGKIILDAWVFNLLPETETGEGWALSRIEALQHQVNAEWDKYACLVSRLPDELRQRHERIYNDAIAKAKQEGWEGEDETRDDH